MFTVIISYDSPDCQQPASLLADYMAKDPIINGACDINVRLLEVMYDPAGAHATLTHRDAVFRTLQELFTVPHENIFVVTFLGGNNSEEYGRMRELLTHMSPPVAHQILTHVNAFQDSGLLVRNMVRRVSAFVAPQPQ